MDIERDGNLIEALVWWVVAVVLWMRRRREGADVRRVLLILAVAFAVFGVSDLIEARTGAWWRPWWLLVIKACCVGVLVWGFHGWHRRLRMAGAGVKEIGGGSGAPVRGTGVGYEKSAKGR